ncbi:MAG: hypothetical protein RBT59_08780 [Arcobacteraceae bacterium]|nr:hypothetical protein [Arcobacteraceae bacterium]
MQHKYRKIIIPGAFGTIIGHKSSDEKEVVTLGDIGEYTYIWAEDLSEQPNELVFESITLSKSELEYLKNNNMYIKALEANVELKIKELVKDYPQFEVDTFTTQEKEANEYVKDNTTSTPFIDNLCESRGIDKQEMVNKILANATILKQMTAPIIGAYQKIVKTN